jgi:TonB family protein
MRTYDEFHMGYQALLFCPDEKTARTVTQVLSELDFAVEPCTEPFVAVKKLMGQHFDAIVVDCDNEQNATLLFKSAHGSASNQNSLAVAVVEGQAGVAKAFRIGANLVLTKPINVEQAKGTLRVARGLLRKGEPAKPASQAAPPRTDLPRPMAPTAPVMVPAASAPARPPVQANSFSPTAKSDTVDPDNDVLGDDSESLTQSPVFNAAPPAATAPKKAATPAPVEARLSKAAPGTIMLSANPPASSASRPYSSPSAAASAPAPARQHEHEDDAASAPTPTKASFGQEIHSGQNPLLSDNPLTDIAAHPPVPLLTFGGITASAQTSSGGSKKIFAAIAVLFVAAVGSYFAWTQLHKKSDLSLGDAKQPAAAVEPVSHVEPAASKGQHSMTESTPTSAAIATTPQPKASATTTDSKPSSFERDAFDYANFDNKSSDSKTSGNKTSASKSPKPSALTSSRDTESAATAKPAAAAPIVVRNPESGAKISKPAADVLAPSPVVIAPTTSGGSLPNILGNSGNVPKPVLQTLNISQGVSRGLLIKKVQPVYPASALRMHVEGAVELQATIGQSGNIVAVKTLTGDLVLARAAKEAVLQWKYKPYLLNGEPVEIQTQITVNFKLPK